MTDCLGTESVFYKRRKSDALTYVGIRAEELVQLPRQHLLEGLRSEESQVSVGTAIRYHLPYAQQVVRVGPGQGRPIDRLNGLATQRAEEAVLI